MIEREQQRPLTEEDACKTLLKNREKVADLPYSNEILTLLDCSVARTHASSLREVAAEFMGRVQENLDKAEGLRGEKLAQFCSELQEILTFSGLALTTTEDGGLHRLEISPQLIELVSIDGSERRSISVLPSLQITNLGRSANQKELNSLAFQSIKLLKDNDVTSMSVHDFFQYFDQVVKHVSKAELKDQFQLWLDNVPDNIRSFDNNVDIKRNIARGLNTRAKEVDCRFKCQRENCESSAGLSVILTGNSVSGQFTFTHMIDGKSVMHASAAKLPRLQLIGED